MAEQAELELAALGLGPRADARCTAAPRSAVSDPDGSDARRQPASERRQRGLGVADEGHGGVVDADAGGASVEMDHRPPSVARTGRSSRPELSAAHSGTSASTATPEGGLVAARAGSEGVVAGGAPLPISCPPGPRSSRPARAARAWRAGPDHTATGPDDPAPSAGEARRGLRTGSGGAHWRRITAARVSSRPPGASSAEQVDGISRYTGPLGGVTATCQAGDSRDRLDAGALTASLTIGGKEASSSGRSCRSPRPGRSDRRGSGWRSRSPGTWAGGLHQSRSELARRARWRGATGQACRWSGRSHGRRSRRQSWCGPVDRDGFVRRPSQIASEWTRQPRRRPWRPARPDSRRQMSADAAGRSGRPPSVAVRRRFERHGPRTLEHRLLERRGPSTSPAHRAGYDSSSAHNSLAGAAWASTTSRPRAAACGPPRTMAQHQRACGPARAPGDEDGDARSSSRPGRGCADTDAGSRRGRGLRRRR